MGGRGERRDFVKRCGMESRAAEEHADAILSRARAKGSTQ